MKEIKITKEVEKDFTKEMAGLDYVPWFVDMETGVKCVNTAFVKRPGRKIKIIRLGGNEK